MYCMLQVRESKPKKTPCLQTASSEALAIFNSGDTNLGWFSVHAPDMHTPHGKHHFTWQGMKKKIFPFPVNALTFFSVVRHAVVDLICSKRGKLDVSEVPLSTLGQAGQRRARAVPAPLGSPVYSNPSPAFLDRNPPF